jgi:putative SOS response-associated peptidase YedK
MSGIPITDKERDAWLRARWSDASALQRPLPDGSLRAVLRGEKLDGQMVRANLATAASQPHLPTAGRVDSRTASG